jgi:hypothetical protein
LPVPIGVGVAQVVDDPVYVSGWTISGLAAHVACNTPDSWNLAAGNDLHTGASSLHSEILFSMAVVGREVGFAADPEL